MRQLLRYAGGRIGRVAGGGFAFAIFTIIYGLTPGEAILELLKDLPEWLTSGWFKLACVVIGLAIITLSLRFNIWSQRQKVVDDLANMLSDAIRDLLNRKINNDMELGQLDADFIHWYKEVSAKIEYHKAYFSKADKVHFDFLGKVPEDIWSTVAYQENSEDMRHNHLLNMLSMKIDRLRDVINWTQQRTR